MCVLGGGSAPMHCSSESFIIPSLLPCALSPSERGHGAQTVCLTACSMHFLGRYMELVIRQTALPHFGRDGMRKLFLPLGILRNQFASPIKVSARSC